VLVLGLWGWRRAAWVCANFKSTRGGQRQSRKATMGGHRKPQACTGPETRPSPMSKAKPKQQAPRARQPPHTTKKKAGRRHTRGRP
jgi:hypothetical protein